MSPLGEIIPTSSFLLYTGLSRQQTDYSTCPRSHLARSNAQQHSEPSKGDQSTPKPCHDEWRPWEIKCHPRAFVCVQVACQGGPISSASFRVIYRVADGSVRNWTFPILLWMVHSLLYPLGQHSGRNFLQLLENNSTFMAVTHCGLVTAYGEHRSGSTLQVTAWCLTTPKHYMRQCWPIINRGTVTLT